MRVKDCIATIVAAVVIGLSIGSAGANYVNNGTVAVVGSVPIVNCSSNGGILYNGNATLGCSTITINGNQALVTTGNGIIGAGVGIDQSVLGDITSRNNGRIGFVGGTNISLAPDTYWSRNSAGVMGLYTTAGAAGTYASGASVGVSCAAGTVNLTTFVVTNGIVTHC